MNGHANCILAVCCPPNSTAQTKALASAMAGALSNPKGDSYEDIAAWVLKNFDLAPAGTLQPFKDAIAQLARENA